MGEGVGGELLGSSHIAFNFHFSLHEGSLGVEGSVENGDCIGVGHGESSIGFAVFALREGTVAVLEVKCPDYWGLSLFGADLEVVDIANFLGDFGSALLEEGFNLIEDSFNFHGHIY